MSEVPVEGLEGSVLASRPVRQLFRRTYPFRTLGLAVAVLPVGVLLWELEAGLLAWVWVIFCGLLWPHVAYLHARDSADPYRAEERNFLIDSAMVGTFLPLMHFNLLPSIMLVTITSADKISSGIPGLLPRTLPGMLATLVLVGAATRFAMDLTSSFAVIVACLPVMSIHTLAVSANGYRLLRKVQEQNHKLRALTHHDGLTSLQSRRHWEQQAQALLASSGGMGRSATLMFIDVDHFKAINDRHGHAAGDDVLRSIAEVIRSIAPDGSHAGRLGGDEFAVAAPLVAEEAHRVAERIRQGVDALSYSVSIGIALSGECGDLRAWMEAADQALYEAKAAGRNRIHSYDGPGPSSLP